jgi:hypothetical protein
MEIKAIETAYKCYRFRSRLEARWAVFFDTLGIKWEYETEGFQFGSKRYLPDFWLPQVSMWAEVKARPLDPTELEKCKLLVETTGYKCVFLVGTPDFKAYEGFDLPYEGMDEVWLKDWIINTDYLFESRFYASTGGGVDEKAFEGDREYHKAIEAARSARFEQTEQPPQKTNFAYLKAPHQNYLEISRNFVPSSSRFKVGDRVRHHKFGEGEVLAAKVSGLDEEVTVRFKGPRGGQKRCLLARMAGLERI